MGGNGSFEGQYLRGEVEVELVPQGTLVEKLRAGGSGIPAFYTATGVGTIVQEGGFPTKLNKDGTVAISSKPKEIRIFNDRPHLLETSIKGGMSLIKAFKADTMGNLIFHLTARNFNPAVATAADVCIAEVEEIVETGELKPDEIHLPGIYVDRIVKANRYEKRIEKLVVNQHKESHNVGKGNGFAKGVKTNDELSIRESIARRAALEFKDGMYANLGIGIPTMAANFVPPDVQIFLQSEDGILGIGGYPKCLQDADPDLINASKETITTIKGASILSSADTFGMIRGGHMDLTMLGSLQVSEFGDIANWYIPGKMVKGMGGAMDLVGSGSKVIVTMEHTAKGQMKILSQCTLPLTGRRRVNRIITELGVMDVTENGLILVEIANGIRLEDVKAATGCTLRVADNLKSMEYA